MRDQIAPGAVIDGYRVGKCIHEGGTGLIFRVEPLANGDPEFPLVMKVPRLGRGEATIGIEGFEMEQTILPALGGPHVPRFVASGDVTATPYIVMEWIEGRALADIIAKAPLPPEEVARIGAALADAVHSVHAQEVIHLDLKPENFLLRPSGDAVLLDFGFAHHARYPDLLGEEKQFAAGSAAYVSPEQLQDNRSDSRSDLFALGVLLYELATGRQPFGQPETLAGMRDRLWREPVPPRAINARVPPWLQEIILRCLERDGAARYQSAAHIALDLRHPEQVALSARSERSEIPGIRQHVMRWWRARREADRRERPHEGFGRECSNNPRRSRHRASRRRSPFSAAMGHPADRLAQRRISTDVRIRHSKCPGRRREHHARDGDWQASRTQDAVTPLGRAVEVAAVARFVACRRSGQCCRYAARPRPGQPCRPDRPRCAGTFQEEARMVAFGSVDRHRERALQRSVVRVPERPLGG